MCILNGYCYVLGGIDSDSNNLISCKRFSLENIIWDDIANLNNPRNGSTSVAVPETNCILIIGGVQNQNEPNTSIEKYDEASNQWFIINLRRPVERIMLESCLLPNSKLVLIFGGKDSTNNGSQKRCYFLNYETYEVTDAKQLIGDFDTVCNMPIIFNNKIYCYFYKSPTERELMNYNISTDRWSLVITR